MHGVCFVVQKLFNEYTFLIFFFLMIAFTVFVYRKVPETKNRTFEEIASQFQPGGDIDVEEIVTDDDDVFGTISHSADVTKVAGDLRTTLTPMTFAEKSAMKNNTDENEEFWVVHL